MDPDTYQALINTLNAQDKEALSDKTDMESFMDAYQSVLNRNAEALKKQTDGNNEDQEDKQEVQSFDESVHSEDEKEDETVAAAPTGSIAVSNADELTKMEFLNDILAPLGENGNPVFLSKLNTQLTKVLTQASTLNNIVHAANQQQVQAQANQQLVNNAIQQQQLTQQQLNVLTVQQAQQLQAISTFNQQSPQVAQQQVKQHSYQDSQNPFKQALKQDIVNTEDMKEVFAADHAALQKQAALARNLTSAQVGSQSFNFLPPPATPNANAAIPAAAALNYNAQYAQQYMAQQQQFQMNNGQVVQRHESTTPLIEAVCGSYYEIVKLLLQHEHDPNETNSAGQTPLMYAAQHNNIEITALLLSKGADVHLCNQNGHTALMEAASYGNVKIAKMLIEEGKASINNHSNEFKESALTLAAYKGHFEMCKYLVEAGADREHKTDEMHTALMEASMDGHVKVAQLLLDHGAQVNMPADSFESPLTLAACGGHDELAALLIKHGALLEEYNDEGYTPLMEAAREGHNKVVALLIKSGAKIDAITEETHETALTLACAGGFIDVVSTLVSSGCDLELGIPLMEAAQEGHAQIMQFLISKGVNVNASTENNSETCLTLACENGHTEIADILLSSGAILDHVTEGGFTALHKACRAGHYPTVKFLIDRKAELNQYIDNHEATPLSLACIGSHKAVVEALLHAGADPSLRLRDNSTCLLEAAKAGHEEIVQILLEHKSPEQQDQIDKATEQLHKNLSRQGENFESIAQYINNSDLTLEQKNEEIFKQAQLQQIRSNNDLIKAAQGQQIEEKDEEEQKRLPDPVAVSESLLHRYRNATIKEIEDLEPADIACDEIFRASDDAKISIEDQIFNNENEEIEKNLNFTAETLQKVNDMAKQAEDRVQQKQKDLEELQSFEQRYSAFFLNYSVFKYTGWATIIRTFLSNFRFNF